MSNRAPSENTSAPDVELAAAVAASEARALFADLADLSGLILAVSGGPDSTALMLLAARWRAELAHGPRLVAVTVDHGLRKGSAEEAAAVKRLALRLGLTHHSVRWRGAKPASGLQEAAREHRYRLLATAARKEGVRHILTAHTRDDQAETVLFRLFRGSGLAGLAGITRRTTVGQFVLVRPFLEMPKSRLVATLAAAQVSYVEDPTNADPRFFRARLRKVMPALAAEGLDAARIAVLARRLARADHALEAGSQAAFVRLAAGGPVPSGQVVLDLRDFCELPAEIALRVLGHGIAKVGTDPVELAKLEALLATVLAAKGGLPPTARIRRTLAGAMVTVERDRVIVSPAPPRRSIAAPRARLQRPVKGPFTSPR